MTQVALAWETSKSGECSAYCRGRHNLTPLGKSSLHRSLARRIFATSRTSSVSSVMHGNVDNI